MPQNTNCQRCPLFEDANHVCMWGVGNAHAPIMLVGEAPGEVEDRPNNGKPFIGSAGRGLDKLLASVGLERGRDVYVTNANKCRPPANRTPTMEEVNACLPYLAEEIASVRPKVILTLGGSPLRAFMGKANVQVGANRGSPVRINPHLRIGDAQVLATYHPAAALHNPAMKEKYDSSIIDDLKLAKRMAGLDKDTNVEKRVLVYRGQNAKLEKALGWISKADVLACDLEWLAAPQTEGIVWPWDKRAGLLSMAFTTRISGNLRTVSVEWDKSFYKTLKRFMSKRRFVFHNGMADLIWLLWFQFKVRLAGDTFLLAYLMDEEQRLGLDRLAPLMAQVKPGWKKPVWRERPQNLARRTSLLEYNADDTYGTTLLYESLRERLGGLSAEERDNIVRCYTRLLLRAVPTFARAAIAGVGFNIEKLQQAIQEQERKRNEYIAEFAEEYVNAEPRFAAKIATVPEQTQKWLAKAYGIDLPSSNQDNLALFAEQYPAVGVINHIRHENKLLGTYLRPWQQALELQSDNRIRSVYRLASSRTGRTSAELGAALRGKRRGASLQLAPREQWLRALVEAHEAEHANDDWELVIADYSQIELRMIAWLAPEYTMRELYNQGEDLHKTTAAYIKAWASKHLSVEKFWKQRRKWVEAVTKEERQGAKGINFGYCYGMQAENFQGYALKTYNAKFTLQEARDARDGYMQLYHDIPLWHERVTENEFVDQLTVTPTGRYRRSFKSPTEAINTPIQTTASDLTAFAMCSIEDELVNMGLLNIDTFLTNRGDAFLIGFIHDSVLLEVRRSVLDDVSLMVKNTMEHPDLEYLGIREIPVPLVADVSTGKTWGAAHEIDFTKRLVTV